MTKQQMPKAKTATAAIELHTDPILVKTQEDAERVRALVGQAVKRAHDAASESAYRIGLREGILLGIREGVRIGRASSLTDSPATVVEALLASPRAQPQPATVKKVERDAEGRIARVVETPA